MDTSPEGRSHDRYASSLPGKENFSRFFFFIASLLILQLQGKMELYAFLLLVILVVCDSIKFNPELQRNILKFGYGINYKYEGMLAHLFDRFYTLTKFM